MARGTGRSSATRGIAIAAVALLTIGVGVLVVLAYQHANPAPSDQGAQPVPTFALGAQTATPTPTPTPEPVFDRASERFLATASGTLWRATAGACSAGPPVIERSNDGGQAWTDVTPGYLGIAQVTSLDGIAVDAAEAVSAVGAGCGMQALRSYTNGEFWADYPDVLAVSRYVDPVDPSVVVMGPDRVAAPCAVAHGLRALRDTVALICEDSAYVWRDAQWAELPVTDAVALAIDGTDVVATHVTVECAGLALTRFASGDPSAGAPIGCAAVTDAASPVALVAYGDGFLIWSGNEFVTAGP